MKNDDSIYLIISNKYNTALATRPTEDRANALAGGLNMSLGEGSVRVEKKSKKTLIGA